MLRFSHPSPWQSCSSNIQQASYIKLAPSLRGPAVSSVATRETVYLSSGTPIRERISTVNISIASLAHLQPPRHRHRTICKEARVHWLLRCLSLYESIFLFGVVAPLALSQTEGDPLT